MIEYLYDTDFSLPDEDYYTNWISLVIETYESELGDLVYNFVDDEGLYKINMEYLQHDTYTDIISFDYSMDDIISGEMFVSVERVADNAKSLGLPPKDELDRVMIHGVLHYLGYLDKTDEEAALMREQEDFCLSIRPLCLE